MYHLLDEMESLIEEELRKIVSKRDMTPMELDVSTKAICLLEGINDLKKSYEENEYSGRRRSYENRERMTDIYPRYENRDSYRGSRRSYNDYSGHDNDITDKMIAKLDDMMADAKTDHERDIINKWISRISEN